MNSFTRTLFAGSLWLAGAAFAQGIAFITNLKGDVALDANPRPLILSELAKGQRLTLGADALASVMYTASGKEFVLKGPGQYEIREAEIAAASGPPPAASATEWRASGKVLTQVAQTSSASVRMRSLAPPKVDTRPKLLFPTEGRVSSLQPVFRWFAPGASGEELTVLVPGQDKPLHRAKAEGGSYRLPAKLKPDTEYAWTVTARGEELGTGKFRTLPASSIQAVERRRPAEQAQFSDRVLFALLLQELGAVQEAKESWARLAQERSDLPELAAFAK